MRNSSRSTTWTTKRFIVASSVVAALGVAGTAGATGFAGGIASEQATSLSGPGDVALLTAPAGTPPPERVFAAIASTPPSSDSHAQQLARAFADEQFSAVRLLRSDETGDIYVGTGKGRLCLAVRRPDNSGAVGCTPTNVAQDPSTPLTVVLPEGEARRVVTLVTNEATEGSVVSAGDRSTEKATQNLIDVVSSDAPDSLSIRYRDGDTASVDLRDADPNQR